MAVIIVEVVDSPLDLQSHLAAVDDARQGATATFIGTVRNHDREVSGEVAHLDYSAHPSAGATIRRIATDVAWRFDP